MCLLHCLPMQVQVDCCLLSASAFVRAQLSKVVAKNSRERPSFMINWLRTRLVCLAVAYCKGSGLMMSLEEPSLAAIS